MGIHGDPWGSMGISGSCPNVLVEFEDFCDGMLCSRNLLDVLVKPESTVLDYLTIHSGITANLLEPISTRLVQVQAALVRFLRPNDILVGHSLENDLHAAQYIHPNVIDTALIFRHRNKRTKFSLKHLAAILLKKKIQAGSHCSEEDAEASKRAGAGGRRTRFAPHDEDPRPWGLP